MIKRYFKKDTFVEIEPTYVKKGIQYYLLRINPQEEGDLISAIEEVYDHTPTDEDKTTLYNDWLTMEKRVKITKITAYDISDQVNIFEINGISAWLNKATRVGLQNSLHIEQQIGRDKTTLYLNGYELTIPIVRAIEMLDALELYALDCYRVTESHKATVNTMEVIEDVTNYDITSNYPDHPVFNF